MFLLNSLNTKGERRKNRAPHLDGKRIDSNSKERCLNEKEFRDETKKTDS
jgi:hypothetical protein